MGWHTNKRKVVNCGRLGYALRHMSSSIKGLDPIDGEPPFGDLLEIGRNEKSETTRNPKAEAEEEETEPKTGQDTEK